MQARQRHADVAPGPSPEELGGRRGARPDDVVEVLGAGLLCPEEVLAAEDERGFVGGEVRGRVEAVGELPGLEGVAPGVAERVRADPAAAATVLWGSW